MPSFAELCRVVPSLATLGLACLAGPLPASLGPSTPCHALNQVFSSNPFPVQLRFVRQAVFRPKVLAR
jgi:hypothetical protein